MKKRLVLVVTSEKEINNAKEVFEKIYESSNYSEKLKAINNFDFRYYTSTEEAEPFFSEACSIITMLETTEIGNFWCPHYNKNEVTKGIEYPTSAHVMFISPHTQTFPWNPKTKGKFYRRNVNTSPIFCTTIGYVCSEADSNFWHSIWRDLYSYTRI